MSNRKLEGIRIREVEGRGGIPRQSAQRVTQPKGRKSGEKTRNKGVSREREREEDAPAPKLFYSSPISFHLSRTKNSLPLASPVSLPKKKVPNTSSIFRAGSPWAIFHTGYHFFRPPTDEICHLVDRAACGRRAAGKILVRVSDWSIVRGRGR